MPAPSSPTSPRDPRYYVPRRPSPLSLPPLAPHMAFQGPATHHVTFQAPSHGFQAFASLAVPNTAHEEGPGRVYKEPRYPLEAQRRFLADARKALNEAQRDKDEGQPKSAGQTLPPPSPTMHQQPQAQLSPTLTLPLTPLSAASTVSQYSQLGDEDDHEEGGQEKRKGGVFCCIGVPWFRGASKPAATPVREHAMQHIPATHR